MNAIPEERAPADFQLGFGPAAAAGSAWVFACVGSGLLLDEQTRLPPAAGLEALGPCQEVLVFGTLDGRACELRLWLGDATVPPGLRLGHQRHLWGHWSEGFLAAANRAQQLATWLTEHRYCGVCGQALIQAPTEPARQCLACGHKAYPRIMPVCIGLVQKGDKLLLGRSPHFPPGIYSALAGFVEAGESAEDCLRREIREEAGIEIANLRWFGSQSWPFPHSLMMGFIADYAGGELRPQPGEIEDLQWFARDALPALPHPATIAYRMIRSLCE